MIAAARSVRGRWAAPRLRGRSSRTLLVVFAVAALVRAWDYATGTDGTAATAGSALGNIERAFPLAVWAGALAVGALLVFGGMLGRWSLVVAAGSVLLAASYFGLTAGLLVEYLGRDWFDGVRGATGLAVPVVWHIIVANHAATQRAALALVEGGAGGDR